MSGDTPSLVIHPASTTHSQLDDAAKVKSGAAPDVVRLSIGIEDKEDLIADLEQVADGVRALGRCTHRQPRTMRYLLGLSRASRVFTTGSRRAWMAGTSTAMARWKRYRVAARLKERLPPSPQIASLSLTVIPRRKKWHWSAPDDLEQKMGPSLGSYRC